MINKILITFCALFTFLNIQAQCVLVPLSLEDRINASTLIVEGQVVSKTCFIETGSTIIKTSNNINISKIFKGSNLIQNNELNIVTLGGQIGNEILKVEPELELEIGSIGIFLLILKDGYWVAESGPQGFINIDKHNAIANDVFNTWPAFTIQNEIVKFTATQIDINSQITKIKINSKRASPIISSISPSTLNAGTSSVLTIKGFNFESIKDTNSVQFKNADNGGSFYIKALKNDYISWSDTMIKLIVRTKAGTGPIRIVSGSNGDATSSDTLTIDFAHLNVVLGDTSSYETKQIGLNNANGISWKLNQEFYDSSAAKDAFIRSLERWRCGTYINWDTTGNTFDSAISRDGTNICAWGLHGSMPSGVLAQCFSYWSGCFVSGVPRYFVSELDIRFIKKPTTNTTWNYSNGSIKNNEYHFESVATHELGHGHQLGHVINKDVVMHFSIANGQTKPNLSNNDISGGDYIIDKSSVALCGMNTHSKLNSGNCAIVPTIANFDISKSKACLNETVIFSDSSTGNISAYSWNFGLNATPSTANTKGPHSVKFNSNGIKLTSLTITTTSGTLIKNKAIEIKNDQLMVPNFTYIANEKGKVVFTNTSNNPLSSNWYFGDNDSSQLTSPTHNYKNGGLYSVKLRATNNCNTKDTTINIKFAYMNFDESPKNACLYQTVTFSDSSDTNVQSWNWTFNGGTPANASGKGPHKVSYNTSGIKSASLEVGVFGSKNQTYTKSSAISVGTDTFTKANFVSGNYGNQTIGFQNLSTGTNMQYKWYFGDGDSSTEKNPIHTYVNANNQTVRLIVSGNCGKADTSIQLKDFTQINKIATSNIKIYPNPISKSFAIDILNFNSEVNFKIIDLSGKIIMEGITISNEAISVEKIESGMYFVQIILENQVQNIPIIIQN